MPTEAEMRKRIREAYAQSHKKYYAILLVVILIVLVSYIMFVQGVPAAGASQVNQSVAKIDDTLKNASNVLEQISRGIR